MKQFKLIFGTVALGLLASCSNETPFDRDADMGEEINSGYIAVKVNLGSSMTTDTRADASGNPYDGVEFNDGEAWEYGVNNARILIFRTSSETDSEDDATFVRSYNLSNSFFLTGPGDDQITSSNLQSVQINGEIRDNDYLWALMMANVPTGMEMPAAGEKFSEYRKKITEINFRTSQGQNNYIFMANAPLSPRRGISENPGQNPGVTTLTRLGLASQKVKATPDEAKAEPAACIYLERGLAKVTGTIDPAMALGFKFVDEEGNEKTAKVTARMSLRNLNNKSYIVRNIVGLSWNYVSEHAVSLYRMVGEVAMPALRDPVHLTEQNLFRTYWCLDPNYSEKVGNTEFTDAANFINLDGKAAFYPMENTFTVDQMTYGNSTLALFEVKFEVPDTDDDNNLFVLNGNHSVVYTTQSAATSLARAHICAQDVVKEALIASFKTGAPAGTTPDMSKYVRIEFDMDDQTNVLVATNVTLRPVRGDATSDAYFDNSSATKFANAIAGDIHTLLSRINTFYQVTKFEGGVAYYQVPIAHFGDYSTPWVAAEGNQTTTTEAYGTGQQSVNNYLGRYGIVRNNWYELNLRNLPLIGEPVVPEINVDLSDDNHEVKKYIGVETHILSWAKRTQHVEF